MIGLGAAMQTIQNSRSATSRRYKASLGLPHQSERSRSDLSLRFTRSRGNVIDGGKSVIAVSGGSLRSTARWDRRRTQCVRD
jgi:hypothetical protein